MQDLIYVVTKNKTLILSTVPFTLVIIILLIINYVTNKNRKKVLVVDEKQYSAIQKHNSFIEEYNEMISDIKIMCEEVQDDLIENEEYEKLDIVQGKMKEMEMFIDRVNVLVRVMRKNIEKNKIIGWREDYKNVEIYKNEIVKMAKEIECMKDGM